MRTIAAGMFKANCLATMDEVQRKHESILITKRGKPVAKLVPAQEAKDDFFGSMKSKAKIVGDIVEPIIPLDEWGWSVDPVGHACCALARSRTETTLPQGHRTPYRGATQF